MFDYLMSEEVLALRDEVRDFIKSVPRRLILDMDRNQIQFPKEFLKEAGQRRLMGCRYPACCGGRDLDWAATCMVMEEVGSLGYIFACIFGVGAELVCDAIITHGTDEQKEKYVKPLLAGEIYAAECLTEPRGGSDFFGTTTTARRQGDHFILNGEKRFIVGAEGADYFLVYARTDPEAEPHKSMTCFVVDRGPGVETQYIYGLMGCRGGGAGRLVFKDVLVPVQNVVGDIHGAYAVFNTMMIPERLGTAAMTIGAARPALEVATGYTTRRKAFGQVINQFQGVSFQVAEAAMLSGLYHLPGGGRRRGPPPDPQDGLGNQKIRHRIVPEGRPQRHAGHGRHRLHRHLPGGADLSGSSALFDLDRHQRGDVHDHRSRVVPGAFDRSPVSRHPEP